MKACFSRPVLSSMALLFALGAIFFVSVKEDFSIIVWARTLPALSYPRSGADELPPSVPAYFVNATVSFSRGGSVVLFPEGYLNSSFSNRLFAVDDLHADGVSALRLPAYPFDNASVEMCQVRHQDYCSAVRKHIALENCSRYRIFVPTGCLDANGTQVLCSCPYRVPVTLRNVVLKIGVPISTEFGVPIAALVQASWEMINATNATGWVQVSSAESQYWRCMGQFIGSIRTIKLVSELVKELDGKSNPFSEHIVLRGRYYYALDSGMRNAGHALERIMEALGQYLHYRLDIPWLSIDFSGILDGYQPVLVQFLHEIANAMNLSIVKVPVSTNVPIEHVVFSNYDSGKNSLCWRRLAVNRLWGVYKSEIMRDERLWPEASLGVALLKMKSDGNATQNSPQRAFEESAWFSALLANRSVTRLPITMPLLHRLHMLNHAEVVVTMWGAALANCLHLLMDRRRPASKPLLLLVLVHPGYIFEARFVFRRSGAVLRRGKKRRMEVLHNLSFAHGAIWDYDGGPLFCARFVLVTTLDEVSHADFDPCELQQSHLPL